MYLFASTTSGQAEWRQQYTSCWSGVSSVPTVIFEGVSCLLVGQHHLGPGRVASDLYLLSFLKVYLVYLLASTTSGQAEWRQLCTYCHF